MSDIPKVVPYGEGDARRHCMITATVRYKLTPRIDYAACREHFHKIAPGFREVKGLISKHFIWNESGWAGGVYQWERIEDARRSTLGRGFTASFSATA
jgi:hypothetical protein